MSFQDVAIPELINIIASNCNLKSIEMLGLSCSKIKNMINDDIIVEKIKEIFPIFLHTYIDFKSPYMKKSKNIDIGDKIGMTGYIDFIRPHHFINDEYKTNIIYGYDSVNRFFISVLYKDLLINETKIATFFQRYSSDKRFYVSCQNTFISSNYCATFNFIMDNFYQKLTEFYEVLFKLLNEGVALYKNQYDEHFSYKLY